MEGIQSQIKDQVEAAVEVLMWIVYAQRPLTCTELLHALAVDIDAEKFDEDNIPDLDDTISACYGLVTIEAESEIVRLVHYTTQEFFESDDGSVWLEGAQLKLAGKCITYLSFDHFSGGICEYSRDYNDRIQNYPFYNYSSLFWGVHARSSGDMVLVREFLNRERQLQASSQVLVIEDSNCTIPWYFASEEVSFMSPISLIAHFGMQDTLHDFLNQYGIDVMDEKLRTPLSYAAANGQSSLVKLLLKEGAKIESVDQHGRTPLEWAATNGHATVLSILIDAGASINGDQGTSALLATAICGHAAALKVLLDQGANINGSLHSRTALYFAAQNGHESTISVLIRKGAKVNTLDDTGWTPLKVAVVHGHLAIAALLLEHGAKVNVRDNEGMTILMAASRRGVDNSIVKLLVDHGEKIAPVDDNGCSALHHAALGNKFDYIFREDGRVRSKIDNVRQLLNYGADLLAVTGNGETALSLASKTGHLSVVHLLMSTYRCRDLEISLTGMMDGRDEHGRNILHYTALQHDLGLFKQLSKGNLQSRLYDNHGKSVLDYAIISGSEEMVQIVLDNIPLEDLTSASTSTWSPLHWACRQGSFSMIKLLVAKGVTASVVQTTFPAAGWAPFDIAAYFRTTDLISFGQLNSESNWHNTIISGIVVIDPDSSKVFPVRANSLDPPKYGCDMYCFGCFARLWSTFTSCHNCGDYYCFMCAKDATSFHVGDLGACLNGGACESTCIDRGDICVRRKCNRRVIKEPFGRLQ